MLHRCITLPIGMVVLIGVNADRFNCIFKKNNCVLSVVESKGHMLNDHSLLSLLGHRR